MSTMRPTPAKIINHAAGLGAPSVETVRERAEELALINGHAAFTEEDWQAARRELHGGHQNNDANGEHDMVAAISEHDMVVSSLGHHVENIGPEDQDSMAEELIAEGMDEAVHEQMLAARQAEKGDAQDEED